MERLPRQNSAVGLTVVGIADERMPDVSQVDAYLMRATRLQAKLKERGGGRAGKPAHDPEVRHRPLSAGTHFPVGMKGADAADGRVDGAFVGLHQAYDDAEVAPLQFAGGDRPAEDVVRVGVLGKEDAA